MDKVYVVKASSVTYEEYRDWIHAIYLTKEEAEAAKDDLIKSMQILKDLPCPIGEDIDIETLDGEEWELYREWETAKDIGSSFSSVGIKEYEIGKLYE